MIEGGTLADPFVSGGEFTPMLGRMMAVGEATGTLGPVMAEVADFHENQLAAAIRRFSALIEPVTIAVVGGIVGFCLHRVFSWPCLRSPEEADDVVSERLGRFCWPLGIGSAAMAQEPTTRPAEAGVPVVPGRSPCGKPSLLGRTQPSRGLRLRGISERGARFRRGDSSPRRHRCLAW